MGVGSWGDGGVGKRVAQHLLSVVIRCDRLFEMPIRHERYSVTAGWSSSPTSKTRNFKF